MYADLVDWQGGRHEAVDRLMKSVALLISGAVEVPRWPDLAAGVARSQRGVDQARAVVGRLRAQATMLKANPAAAEALTAALQGVARTYEAVGEAVETFLTPIDRPRAMTLARYRPLATGRLTADIASRRGHCTRIAQAYIAEGGLRESLPQSIDPAALTELDELFSHLSTADDDLFAAMGEVGNGLTNEASAVVNLLLSGQKTAAMKRTRAAARRLAPLVRDLNRGQADLNRLAGELGLVFE
jgi:hypothetical protein